MSKSNLVSIGLKAKTARAIAVVFICLIPATA